MPRTLDQWLSWQSQLHPDEIELGLERLQAVWSRLSATSFNCPVITIAGSNGKGSTVAILESILSAAGYHCGCYTSPHILHYNERVRIDQQAVSDELLCAAFEQVEQARQAIALTYFEFGTLAALWLFQQQTLDVVILEVGLGGRLDAVNIIDADVAVLTSLSLEHRDWLGDDLQQIGYEKAGIFRAQRPAVCGIAQPPDSVKQKADEIGARLLCLKRDFDYQVLQQHPHQMQGQWCWHGQHSQRKALPMPALRGTRQLQNAAVALAALEQLDTRIPVDQQAVRRGLIEVRLAGRFQVLPGAVDIILDVAHNPESVQVLKENLQSHAFTGRTHAVFSLLADKDIANMLAALADLVDDWYIAPLKVPRATSSSTLRRHLQQAGARHITEFDSVASACDRARAEALAGDRIVVFGSFYTVADAWAACV